MFIFQFFRFFNFIARSRRIRDGWRSERSIIEWLWLNHTNNCCFVLISIWCIVGLYCRDFSSLNMELEPEEIAQQKWADHYKETAEVWQSTTSMWNLNYYYLLIGFVSKIYLLLIDESLMNKQRIILKTQAKALISSQLRPTMDALFIL